MVARKILSGMFCHVYIPYDRMYKQRSFLWILTTTMLHWSSGHGRAAEWLEAQNALIRHLNSLQVRSHVVWHISRYDEV